MGMDRDKAAKEKQGLPSAEDLDKIAEEEDIKNATGVQDTLGEE